MTFVAHALVTTVGIKFLHLSGEDIFLAYLFGVFIDWDHLLRAPLFFKKHQVSLKDVIFKDWSADRHYHWRTILQEPISLLWIIPLSIFINSWVVVIFFLGHLALDYLCSYPKLPFYPFSKFINRGFLLKIPDSLKEV